MSNITHVRRGLSSRTWSMGYVGTARLEATMKLGERKRFIRELCASVQKSLLEDARKMPDKWNGFQLRELIARRFQASTYTMDRRQMREFENDLIEKNL